MAERVALIRAMAEMPDSIKHKTPLLRGQQSPQQQPTIHGPGMIGLVSPQRVGWAARDPSATQANSGVAAAAALGRCGTAREAAAMLDLLERTPRPTWAAAVGGGGGGGGDQDSAQLVPRPPPTKPRNHRNLSVSVPSAARLDVPGAAAVPLRPAAPTPRAASVDGSTTPRIDEMLARYSPRRRFAVAA